MTFPETVKTTLWDIIDEMSLSISSFANNPDKDFLRRRKLDFKKMMRLIISMESGSMNHEFLKLLSTTDFLCPEQFCILSTTFETVSFCFPSSFKRI